MDTVNFQTGLAVFSDRHARVQRQLSDIEQRGLVPRHMRQYRRLLDELIQIGVERAHYCAQWQQKQLAAG
ncbi:MAG: hypothetical protein VYA55_03825 [Pseudomonadota bacterium]|nr:hypothetical protein [Pseudomonadota bacterium]